MTCREIAEFLDRYLAGELPEPDREQFEEHLRVCPDCVAYLTTYAATPDVARTACRHPERCVQDEIPAELAQAILDTWRRRAG